MMKKKKKGRTDEEHLGLQLAMFSVHVKTPDIKRAGKAGEPSMSPSVQTN